MKVKIRLFLAGILVLLVTFPPPAYAQTCIQNSSVSRATGLISATERATGDKFGTSGACVVSPQTSFTLPSFSELKSTYYTHSRTIDSTSAIQSQSSGNQVYNASFEVGTTTPAQNWSLLSGPTSSTRTLELQPTANGCWSLKSSNASGPAPLIVGQVISSLQPNYRYELTGNIYRTLPSAPSAYIEATGIPNPATPYSCTAHSTTLGGWEQVRCSFVAATGQTSVSIKAVTGVGSGAAYFDDIQLKALTPTTANTPAVRFAPNSTAASQNETEDYFNLGTTVIRASSMYNISGDLTINNPITAPPKAVVVFVDRNLLINKNLDYGTGNPLAGMVFVVNGDVRVHKNVTRIDGVFITSGTFCSATANLNSSDCPDPGITTQLTINGSVIALNSAKSPQFVRRFLDNTQPAEKINFDPKYLVLLKDLLSSPQRVVSEVIKPAAPTTTSPPAPTALPTPTATPTSAPSIFAGVPDPGTSAPTARTCPTTCAVNPGDNGYEYDGTSCVPSGTCPDNRPTEPSISSCGNGVADVFPGAVGVWQLNSSSGSTAIDLTRNLNNGTLVSSPTWTSLGKFGNALTLNGTNQYIEVPNSSSLDLISNKASITAWVYLTDPTRDQKVVFKVPPSNDKGYGMGIFGQKVEVGFANCNIRGASGGTVLQPNSWYYLAATYDGATCKTYVNGQLDRSAAGSGNLISTTANLRIGGDLYATPPVYPLGGLIDEVMVFNKDLTQTQIQGLMTGIGVGRNYATGTSCSLSACTISSSLLSCPPGCSPSNGTYHLDGTPDQFNCSANYASVSFCSATTGGCTSASGVAGGTATVGREYYVPVDSCSATAPCDLSSTFQSQCSVCKADGTRNTYHDATSCGAITCPYPVSWSSTNQAGYWNFDAGAGPTAADSSPYSNTGTLVNGTAWSSVDKFGGKSLSFDGANDSVTVPDSASLRINKYTVSAWIRPSIADNIWAGVVGKPGRNFNMWLGNANTGTGYIHHKFHTTSSTSDGCPDSSAVTINGTTWTHVVITNDGTTCKTYLNGTQEATGTFSGSLVTDNTILYIGQNLDGGAANYYRGFIDDVRIYSRALSASEVKALYNWQPGFSTPSADQCTDACTSSPRTFYDGTSCIKVACPNNYQTGTTCPAGGCTSSCTSAGCGSQASYVVDGVCGQTDGSQTTQLCTITTTSSDCPGGDLTTCYTGPDQYYHGNACTPGILCPHNYQNGGNSTVATCPADGCSSRAGGTQRTYIPANTCAPTTANCSLSNTSSRCTDDLFSTIAGADNGCDESGGIGSVRTYHTGAGDAGGGSCTATSCSVTASACIPPPADQPGGSVGGQCFLSTDTPPYSHAANNCTLVGCSHNYYAATCYTGSNDCPDNLCYAANTRTCYPANACTKSSYCPANNPTPCSSCSASCTDSPASCYTDACVASTCGNNYPAANAAPPACRTSSYTQYSGSNCGTTYAATNPAPCSSCTAACTASPAACYTSACVASTCGNNYPAASSVPACRTAIRNTWSIDWLRYPKGWLLLSFEQNGTGAILPPSRIIEFKNQNTTEVKVSINGNNLDNGDKIKVTYSPDASIPNGYGQLRVETVPAPGAGIIIDAKYVEYSGSSCGTVVNSNCTTFCNGSAYTVDGTTYNPDTLCYQQSGPSIAGAPSAGYVSVGFWWIDYWTVPSTGKVKPVKQGGWSYNVSVQDKAGGGHEAWGPNISTAATARRTEGNVNRTIPSIPGGWTDICIGCGYTESCYRFQILGQNWGTNQYPAFTDYAGNPGSVCTGAIAP